jgi:3-deoxy-D-manno-octulosonic-acid transferase
MIRHLYSLCMWLAQPLLRRKLLRRAQAEPAYGLDIDQRFGHYSTLAGAGRSKAAEITPGPRIWVHAVSLGESRAAAVLVQRLRVAVPGMRLLLTHGTATGLEAGKVLLLDGDVQVWQPWDMPGAVARFLAFFKPQIGLLMETEVWPNLVAGCVQADIPLCLVNARLSEKSMRSALRLASLSRPAYGALTAAWAQTRDDGARLRRLGANVEGIFGNLKFDATPDPVQVAQGRAWRAASDLPVLMFASAREGEEAMWLAALQIQRDALKTARCGPIQWLIVPRHPQRFDEVESLLLAAGYGVSRRSHWQDKPPSSDPSNPAVWLGDSLGEMALYYGASDIALLGGSFANFGGQNLIEAAACACPVIMGPNTFNFAEAAQGACDAGAGAQVPDLSAAIVQALGWLENPEALLQARNGALHWSQLHRGAAEASAAAIAKLLSRNGREAEIRQT